MDESSKKIPTEAALALKIIKNVLGSTIVGVYLYGSAVNGGLRINSDVDILVIVNQPLTPLHRRKLLDGMMIVSGRMGNRPLEITIINKDDIVPWKYPPKKEFTYGEWLRDEFEKGWIPEPSYDPDLAILLVQAKKIVFLFLAVLLQIYWNLSQ
jgi:aminoglycoside 9-adenylyltransferase